MLLRFFSYIRWPLALGLLAALIALTVMNQSRGIAPTVLSSNNTRGMVASYAGAVHSAKPAVVNIYTRKKLKRARHPLFDDPLFRHFFNNADTSSQERMQSALGSGVIVTETGYLLTNNHVIAGADEIVIQLQDGREAQADLIGIDKENDLAVLKIELDQLTAIAMSTQPHNVGDVVLAIGNPFGKGQTVTQGIISAVGRYGLGINTFENFIQTDAAINPGNSGGALIDAYGQLVGINSAMLNRIGNDDLNGVGLAIPAATAMQSLNDIIEFGQVVRGWLGITAEPITPQMANRFRLPSHNGLLVTGIYTGGPAHKSGLQHGDIIVKINNQRVNNGLDGGLRGMQEVQESRPGEQIELEVYREGQRVLLTAILSVNPAIIDG